LSETIIVRRPVSRVTVRPGRMTLQNPSEQPDRSGKIPVGPKASLHARAQGKPEQFVELQAALARAQQVQAAVNQEAVDRYEAMVEAERARVDEFLASMEEQLEFHDQKIERTVVQLAVTIAELIVKREVSIDREIVLREAREALRRVVGVQQLTLRVNPFDLELVRGQKSALMAGAESIRDLRIEPDEAVARGGCIVESDSGNVDARLSTQLRNIEMALLDAGREGHGDR
jgi:flagellar assembly protein FliH